jgi:cysteine desulfuration protein SufE
MDLAEKQQTLIDDYSIIEDPMERFAAIVDRARSADPVPEEARVDENLVPGCTSRVWLVGNLEDGLCQFRVDADAPTVKGVAVLLCDLYSNATPGEVVAVEPECIEKLGIDRVLTPTRLNGLRQIRQKIRRIADSLE